MRDILILVVSKQNLWFGFLSTSWFAGERTGVSPTWELFYGGTKWDEDKEA